MQRLYASMRAPRAADPGGRKPGERKADGAHSLHLRLGSLLRLGQRAFQPAPDQHRDTWHHRLVRGRHARDGSLDLDQAVSGELELAVERLTSGNQLYDRELRRRIDARRYPTIAGRLTDIVLDGSHPDYGVTGEVSFHGKTRTFSHGMQIGCTRTASRLTGEDVFDIREFGMKPPSMLMVRVYPEISVRVELHGVRDDIASAPHARSGRQFAAFRTGIAGTSGAECRIWHGSVSVPPCRRLGLAWLARHGPPATADRLESRDRYPARGRPWRTMT